MGQSFCPCFKKILSGEKLAKQLKYLLAHCGIKDAPARVSELPL
jgi:hypothetical protein